jgi:hypothetical protein
MASIATDVELGAFSWATDYANSGSGELWVDGPYESASGTITPWVVPHAPTHGVAGGDPVTITEAQVSDLSHFTPDADPGVDHPSYVAGHGDGANCDPGEWAAGSDGAGNAQGCTPDATTTDASELIGGTIPAARVGADHIDALSEITSGLRTGAAGKLVTGTAGAATDCAMWTADGDLVSSGAECGSGGGGLLYVRHEESSGTNCGTGTASAWNIRTLNTVMVNSIPGASLASNRVTLPTGTYRISAVAPAYRTFKTKTRWRNVTDGATVIVGENANSLNVDGSSTAHPTLWGRFTIADSKEFEFQQYFTSNGSGTACLCGCAVASGEPEVYAQVWIERE